MGQPLMPIHSAGILMYRARGAMRQVLLIHMGGPFWAGKDEHAWSIPKGVIADGEDPLDAARREFQEETGFIAQPPFESLGTIRQNSAKSLSVWACAGDCDPRQLASTNFTMVWPPGSGRIQQFPEADRAAWLERDEALRKIVKGQRPVLERFFAG
jgi:predicted NUDIX family NTP pyrophosphohydrolase